MAFPTVAARTTGDSGTSNSTTHAVTLPAGVVPGELLLVAFSVDGATVSSTASTGWTKLAENGNGTNLSAAVFSKVATGSDALSVDTDVSEKSSWVSWRISGAATPILGASDAGGSSSSWDPPNLAAGTAQDYLWLAIAAGDASSGTGNSIASAAPANYGNLTTVAAQATNSAGTSTAERSLNAAAEDPGAFTHPAEQWVTFTVAVPPAPEPQIQIDASTPAQVTGQANPLTTASFTPPTGALLIAFVTTDTDDTDGNIHTVSGGGLTWTLRGRKSENAPGNTEGAGERSGVEIWSAYADGSSLTVSAEGDDSSNLRHMLKVVVFTGAESSWGGNVSAAADNGGSPSDSVTTSADGAWVWAVSSDWNGTSSSTTYGSGQAEYDIWHDPNWHTGRIWRQTAVTASSLTSVTMNQTAPSGQWWNELVFEIRPGAQSTEVDLGPGETRETATGFTTAKDVDLGPGETRETATGFTTVTHADLGPTAEPDEATGFTAVTHIRLGPADEHESGQAFTLASQVSLGPATDHEAGESLSAAHAATLGAAETHETGQALGARRALTLGAAETHEASEAPGARRALTLGAAETHEASEAPGATEHVAIGAADEHDTGQPVASAHALTLGAADSAETGEPATARTQATLGAAEDAETGDAFTAAGRVSLGPAQGHDEANPAAATHTLSLGPADEHITGAALTPSTHVAIGAAEDAETGDAFTARTQATLGAAETHTTGEAVTGAYQVDLGVADEHDAAVEFATQFGPAVSAEIAQPFGVATHLTLGVADTHTTGEPIDAHKDATLAPADEHESATPFQAPLGVAAEPDEARGLGVATHLTLGAAETHEAGDGVTVVKDAEIGRAQTHEAGQPIRAAYTRPLGAADTHDDGERLAVVKHSGLGPADEHATAADMGGPLFVTIGVATEHDTGTDLQPPPPFITDGLGVHMILTDVLACLCERLEQSLGGPVCRCSLLPGQLIADYCGHEPGQGNGQATIRVVSIVPSVQFPNPDFEPRKCPMGTYALNMEMAVMRCAPAPDEHGRPPTPESLSAITEIILSDAAVMRQVISCCLAPGCTGLVVGEWTPVGTGGCAGGLMTVAIPSDDCTQPC